MVDPSLYPIDRKTWGRWSFYLTILIFLIIAVAIYFLIIHTYNAGKLVSISHTGDQLSQVWFFVTADIAVIAVCLTYIFARMYSFHRYMRRR